MTVKTIGGKVYLYSKDGKKKLGGPYKSKDSPALKKRERQVQHFKKKN